MPSTYSPNLAFELIGDHEQAETWGITTNTLIGTLIEEALGGYTTQAITDGADTTIAMTQGASAVARHMFLELTGSLTAARNLIVPAVQKLYFIYNNTSGGFAVTVKANGQTGVSVPAGAKVLLAGNGTDFIDATNYLTTLRLGPTGFADTEVARAKFKDYSLTVNPLGNVTGTGTVDYTLGNYVTATSTGITTWTFSNPPATGIAGGFVLKLTNGGAFAQTWPTSVKWPGGTAPTLTASGVDVLVFLTDDAGTTWRGVASQLDSR